MFKKLGGKAAIEGVVDEFYSRVFVDDEVKGFFEGINKQGLKSHQVPFLLYSLCICCRAFVTQAHVVLQLPRLDATSWDLRRISMQSPTI